MEKYTVLANICFKKCFRSVCRALNGCATNGCIYLTSTPLCKHLVAGLEPEKTFAESAVFDPHDFDMKQLRDILIKCGEKENSITLHPDKSSDGSIEKLEAFLANPIGTYLVPQDSFTGMEARNIILILSEHDFFHSDDTIFVRCHLSRAVSNLCVIQELKNNQSDYMLPSMDVDGSFLKCCKELKQIAFKFPTQEEDYVCYPCWIVCHQD